MISVIIVVYNAENYLKLAIESVYRQSYKQFEIIAVNDGSTDKTSEILRSYENLDNFTIINKEHNKNLGGNRNEAIKIAKGDYIAFIDGDDIWLENKLEIQIKFIEKYKMICSNAILINEYNEIISEKYSYDFDANKELYLADLLINNWVTVSSVLIKKEAIIKAGYFEDGPDTRAEDYYLWLNYLEDPKSKILYINNPLLKYRIHNNNWANSTTENWIRLLKRTIKIRSAYLDNKNEVIRKAAKNGCISIYLIMAKYSFKKKNYSLSRDSMRNVLNLFDVKIGIRYLKYILIYLFLKLFAFITRS